MSAVQQVMFVAVGGALGSASRFAVKMMTDHLYEGAFPWATLVVNLAGCLLIGIAFGLADLRSAMNAEARLFFITGFLGAFTTFSAFALESLHAARAGAHTTFFVNVLANNLGCLAMVMIGFFAVKFVS